MSNKRYPRTILATVCIPWTESYQLDERILRDEIRNLIKRDIHNIYLFGTAGEGYAVTDEQFDEIVRIFADEMKAPGLFPMVGLVSLSFGTMLKRLEKAYSYGIRDFQFSLPSWGVLTDSELFSFVHKLCDPYPDCRFLNYNLMRTKRVLGIAEFEKLAEEIPNFVGVKYSNPDITTTVAIAGSSCPLQFFLTEIAFGYASMVGEFGYLISLGTSNIRRAWEYYNAAVNQDKDKLLLLQQEFCQLSKGLMKSLGGNRIDGAYDKVFSKLIDKEFPLRLLPPYEYASEENFNQYRSFLEKECPQWLEKN